MMAHMKSNKCAAAMVMVSHICANGDFRSFGLKPFLSKELTQSRAISRLSVGLHQPTAQSRIFERLFDVHSEAEDLGVLSFWECLRVWTRTGNLFGMSTDSTMQSTIARPCSI